MILTKQRCILPLVLLLSHIWISWSSGAQSYSLFIIEAEDFNYDSGKHLTIASQMPYLGGAYQGLGATYNIDYYVPSEYSQGNIYRLGETPNVAIADSIDLFRDQWIMNVNFRLQLMVAGSWFNYTRSFPEGWYKVYAAISHVSTAANMLTGRLYRVTSNPMSPDQQLQLLGYFSGPGTGQWGLNRLVPLMTPDGKQAVVYLSGLTTLRYEVGRGDPDYFKFIPIKPPQIITQPIDLTVEENQPADFKVEVAEPEFVFYQWQSNRVNIIGATNAIYRIEWTPLSADGALYRCIISNYSGHVISKEVKLRVLPDRRAPVLVNAVPLSSTQLLVEFSEPVSTASALDINNYTISDGINVVSAAFGLLPTQIILSISPIDLWHRYVLTVRDIEDRALIPNKIEDNTKIEFVYMDYVSTDIGTPPIGGLSIYKLNGYDEMGSGAGIGANIDQLHFNYRVVKGNFDYAVRLISVTASNPYAEAGLMARGELNPSSAFFAVIGTFGTLGIQSVYRGNTGGSTVYGSKAPSNYPYTWLRIRREGNLFTGYVSYDGTNWLKLLSITIGMPEIIYLGHVVSSKESNSVAWAQFREPTNIAFANLINKVPISKEPLAPSSRRTRVVFSEIMYNPAPREDGKDLEFIEIANPDSIFEEIGGWKIEGDITYEFPKGTVLPAGGFLVVAKNPEDIRAVYGITNVVGPYQGRLNNGGGTVRLRNHIGALLLEVNFSDRDPWPASADGGGHSLVLIRPSYGENDPYAWGASSLIGGSPGRDDPYVTNPWEGIVINEFLAHTDLPQLDYIELYNKGSYEIDLSDCILTDNPAVAKFVIPKGTKIRPGGFITFYENELGFALSALGETIFLIAADGSRVIDAFQFDAQENGRSMGRFPDGNDEWRILERPTPGIANARPWIPPVVINEIMYNPISADPNDEYIELYNRTAQPIDISGWKFIKGISYEFPQGVTIPPYGYIVIAKNVERLLSNYPHLNRTNTFGPYTGVLSDKGETIALARPDTIIVTNRAGQVVTNVIYPIVNEVRYQRGGRWGKWANGGGSSLELIDPNADNMRPSNWADSDETQKSRWTTISITERLDNGSGFGPDRLFILLLGEGECLVDDVEVYAQGSLKNLVNNGGFESGNTGWSFFGNHKKSYIQTGGAFSGSRCLHIVSDGDGDTGPNSIRTALTSTLATGRNATIRAKVRWLAGWPQILFRLRGNWLELAGEMEVPKNLGTPGLRNSRWVPNAGPAIWDVKHDPVLPQAMEPVRIFARVDDPHGVSMVTLCYRVDPDQTINQVPMRDDGQDGDDRAGDGIYTVTIEGMRAGTLIAFHIKAKDKLGAETVFPAKVPEEECLVRWGDPIPGGDFAHYHIWATQAVMTDLNTSNGLDNSWRDMTLIYRDCRIIYNAKFRHKGSPYHQGRGDYAVTVPLDDLLLGTDDRVFASTGNGGSEETAMRGQIANWMASELGIPFLHSKYMRLYINGSQFRNVVEDLEQPNRYYAERWFPDDPEGDLYKVAVWFEFQDDNTQFSSVGATLQKFTTTGGAYKLARYRWNWQIRPKDRNANWYTPIFELVEAANISDDHYVSSLSQIADMEEWMRVFAWNRVTGNWDSWAFNVGQNMFVYKCEGNRWKLIPWDIDFVLGLGNGPTDALWGGQDPVVNRMFQNPTFQRALWRTFIDAVKGPMQPERYLPQINARSAALSANRITGVSSPSGIITYMEQRRAFLEARILQNNAPFLRILTNDGKNFISTDQIIVLEGEAPFEAAFLAVNGLQMAAEWISPKRFKIRIPLWDKTNQIVITALDRFGNPISGLETSIMVQYVGEVERPEDYIVINEIYYAPLAGESEFIEIYNRSERTTFNLSGWRINGIGYEFPPNTLLPPRSFLVVVQDIAAFQAKFGQSIPVVGPYSGSLDNGGETISLLRPGGSGDEWIVVDEVRYDDDPPWPFEAKGWGSSLQLINSNEDNWRVGNWATASTNSNVRVTPGNPNSVIYDLEAFPPLWINEIQLARTSGLTDAAGELDPWIEIYNAGDYTVDLGGLYLSDDPNVLKKWSFPPGTLLPPHSFLIVWVDGQSYQSSPSELHTNFRLNGPSGIIILSRTQPVGNGVIDYVHFELIGTNLSYGSYPDGQGKIRRRFDYPTPGLPNNPAVRPVQIYINEWMASNNGIVVDPADGNFDDWFELYNAGPEDVDLTDYYLSDDPNNPRKFRIPPGFVIPAGGFLLVWADEQPNQTIPGKSLHVNFKLSADGESIALYAPDGSLVDIVSFGAQGNNVSEGRDPDGGMPPFVKFDTPTPGAPNVPSSGNHAPIVEIVSPQIIVEGRTLQIQIQAWDPDEGQVLSYHLIEGPLNAQIDSNSGIFVWTPSELDGPGNYTVTIWVSDNGSPRRTSKVSFEITVLEENLPPKLEPVPHYIEIMEGIPWSMQLKVTDPDIPLNQIRFELIGEIPEGLNIDSLTGMLTWTPSEDQGPGKYLVSVRVWDNGIPPLSDTITFIIEVKDIDNPPVILPIPKRFVTEGRLITFNIEAYDPDCQPNSLRYELIGQVPAGAKIDMNTGSFTWIPSEYQGPGIYTFRVRVSELDSSPQYSEAEFVIEVLEENQPPRFKIPTTPLEAKEGELFILAPIVEDLDIPSQEISLEIVGNRPEGLIIDNKRKALIWDVPYELGVRSVQLYLRATDNGSPPLATEGVLQINVQPSSMLRITEIQYRTDSPADQYIEIQNVSRNRVEDLTGLQLRGRAMRFDFPARVSLKPGEATVVVRSLDRFKAAYPEVPLSRIAGQFSGLLAQGRDLLTIMRVSQHNEEVIDQIRYMTSEPWPKATPTASIQRLDPLRDGRMPANWIVISSTEEKEELLITFTNTWYYNDEGIVPPTNWKEPTFDPIGWKVGQAILCKEEASLPAPKNTELQLGQITYYFITDFDYYGPVDNAKLLISTIVDDGCVIWLNGKEILRIGMPGGEILPDTLANRTVGDAVVEGPFEILTPPLRWGRNRLAVEVHQASSGSSDIVWAMELRVSSGELRSSSPADINSIRATLPRLPALWLNEICTGNANQMLDRAKEADPWLEVWNSELAWWPAGDFQLRSGSGKSWRLTAEFDIEPLEHLLIWLDGQPHQTLARELHSSLTIDDLQGRVQLEWINKGQTYVIDSISFVQIPFGLSAGYATDGDLINYVIFTIPTPGAPNGMSSLAPVIEVLNIDWNDTVKIRAKTTAGVRYRLLATDKLPPESWQILDEKVAVGSTLEFEVPIIWQPKAMFYMIEQLGR